MNIYLYSLSFAHVPKARYSETYVLLYCRSTTLRVPLPPDGRRERRPEGPPGAWTRTAALCPARPIGNSGERARACGGTGASPIAAACLPCPCPRGSTSISIHQRTVRAGRAPRRLIILLRRAARSVQCRGGVQVLAVCAVRVAVQCSSHKTRPT